MRKTLTALGTVLAAAAPAAAQEPFVLDEIVFAANLGEVETLRTGASVEVVTEEDLEQTAETRVADYLARLPGLSVLNNGGIGAQSSLQIRGLGGAYLAVRVDGIDVSDPSQTETQFDFGTLTTADISRIEVVKGSQSALYGSEAVAGVIDITTNRAEEDGTVTRLSLEGGSYATYKGSLNVSTRGERGEAAFTLSRVQTDGFSAADENAGNTEEDGHEATRLSFSAAYDATPDLRIGLSGFLEESESELDGFGAADTPVPLTERSERGLRAFAELQTGAVAHEFSVSAFRRKRVETSSFSVSDFRGARDEVAYVGEAEISPTLDLVFGLNWVEETARYANAPGGEASSRTSGGFLQALYAPTDRLDVGVTARLDDHSEFGRFETARLNLSFRPDDTLTLRGAVGTGYRAPAVDELYGDYAAFDFVGNPDLVPEESLSAEIGFDKRFAGGASLSATLFSIELENEISFVSCPFTDPANLDFSCQPGTISTLENQPGTSTRRGLELAADMPVTDSLNIFGNYTYLDAKDADGGKANRVPRHDLTLGASASFGDRLSGIAAVQHVADYRDGSVAMDDYTVANATLTYQLNDRAEAYLRVENLFDSEYQVLNGYGTSDRAFYVGLRASF